MGKHTKPPLPWALAWQPQQKTLTLEGEPVAQLSLSLPQIKSGGRGGQRINRYYQALGRAWLRRWEGAYVELTLHLREPLSSAQVRALKEANAGLVNLIPEIRGELSGKAVAGKRTRSAGELFTEFYRAQFSEDPAEGLKQLFLSLAEEAYEA